MAIDEIVEARRRTSPSRAPASPRARFDAPVVLSGVLAAVTSAAAAIALAAPGVFHDPAVTVGNARGTALVILVVAVPTLLIAMALARRGAPVARLAWLGALGYLLYNSVLFAFGVAFNPLFLLYVASLGLSVWGVVALLVEMDPSAYQVRPGSARAARAAAAFLLLQAVLFGWAWLSDIVPATIHDRPPRALNGTLMLTNPVHVLDLTLTLPLAVLAAVWLWRRHPWAPVVAGGLLVALTIESLSVAVDQVFGHRSDPTQSLGAVPLMAGLALVGLAMTYAYLRSLSTAPAGAG